MANEFLQAYRFMVEIAGFRSSEFSSVSSISLVGGTLVLTRGVRAGDLDCVAWAKSKEVRALSVVLLGADGEPCITYSMFGEPIRYGTSPLDTANNAVFAETLMLAIAAGVDAR